MMKEGKHSISFFVISIRRKVKMAKAASSTEQWVEI
jgi:hypothetical protein